MYVGHALVGFVLALAAARAAGLDRRRALSVGLIGGGYGLLPDVDMARTLYAVLRLGPTNVFPTTRHVWTESWVIHRTLTHSLVVGVAATVLAAAVVAAVRGRARRDSRAVLAAGLAVATAAGLLWLGVDADGGLGAVTMALYLCGATALAAVAARRGLSPAWTAVAAALGLLAHPPGDVWMGRPPAMAFPLSETPVDRVHFAADPTLDFLTAVGIEVGLLAVASALALWTLERPVAGSLTGWIGLGVGQVAALALVAPPTWVVAYRFSFLMVGVGLGAGAAAALTRTHEAARTAPTEVADGGRPAGLPVAVLVAALNGASAMLLGLGAYVLGYVVL